MKNIVGTHDILWLVLDTLRYDVAQQAFQQNQLPTLSQYLPSIGWEKRHTPASFTYPAHHAFFAGFLPTPARPGKHHRLFAAEFTGSTSTSGQTFTFPQATVPEALAAHGYHTACIGGVGFFNPDFALGRVLPGLFQEQHWTPATGTGHKHCVENQVKAALNILAHERFQHRQEHLFLFINIPSIHSPNHFYLSEHHPDKRTLNSLAGHYAALRYTDQALRPLFNAIKRPTFCIVCSDHGTAYGEDGYQGHRLAHEVIWEVPYSHFFINTPS